MDINDLGKKAISPDKPAGDDPQGLPEFEQLDAEIAKATSLVATGGIDWQKVRRLAETILESKSKHLMTASYLSVALLRQEKLPGLARGVHILLELLENFWVILFPPLKRMRGRKNAIDWWLEKTDAELANLAPEKWTAEQRDKFMGDLDALDSFISQNLPDAPYLRPLIEKINTLIQVEEPQPGSAPPAPAPPPAQPAAPLPQAPVPASSSPPMAAPAVDLGDADKTLRQGLDLLAKAAGAFRQKDPCHPLAFRLNRLAAWLPVQSAPPAADGKTRLPAPDKNALNSLRGLRQSGNWNELLAAAESRVNQYLFWLDLSCWAAESLTRLGHPELGREIGDDTVAFVQRVPGLDRLAFADGTPFADPDTRAWLSQLSSARAPAGPSDGGGSTGNELGERLQAAEQLLAANKIGEAIELFSGKIQTVSSLREKLMWEVGLCRLLNLARKTRLAGPFIKDMLELIDTHRLERWEPDLALEALMVIWTGLRQLDDKKDAQLLETVFDRITALKPSKALELI